VISFLLAFPKLLLLAARGAFVAPNCRHEEEEEEGEEEEEEVVLVVADVVASFPSSFRYLCTILHNRHQLLLIEPHLV
jgi:hypothetical protein